MSNSVSSDNLETKSGNTQDGDWLQKLSLDVRLHNDWLVKLMCKQCVCTYIIIPYKSAAAEKQFPTLNKFLFPMAEYYLVRFLGTRAIDLLIV